MLDASRQEIAQVVDTQQASAVRHRAQRERDPEVNEPEEARDVAPHTRPVHEAGADRCHLEARLGRDAREPVLRLSFETA
jgi:hypothetical protein